MPIFSLDELAISTASVPPPGRGLLDLAAVQALTRGAAVHVVEPPRMPEPATAAAIFRY